MKDTGKFIVYNIPLRGTDTGKLFSNFQLAEDLKNWLQANKLAGTWLLRWDALNDPEYRKLCEELDERQEIGLWLEVTESHAKAASVRYQLPAGHFWAWGEHCTTMGYSQKERIALIDAAMDRFQKVFKKTPRTVSMWMLDSFSAEYMNKAYGVKAIGLCREQYAVDGYSLWGGWENLPYWPSKRHLLHPARTKEGRADYIVYPTITADPLLNYDSRGVWTTEPFIIQINRTPSTVLERFVDPLVEDCLRDGDPLGLAAFVSENGAQRWEILGPAYKRQIDTLGEICRSGGGRSVGAGELAAWCAKRFEKTSEGQLWLREGTAGTSSAATSCALACLPKYRARLRADKDGSGLLMTDLRVYDENAVDPYWNSQSEGQFALWVVPFVLDSALYGLDGRKSKPDGDAPSSRPMRIAVEDIGSGVLAAPREERLVKKGARKLLWREPGFGATWSFGDDAIRVEAESSRRGAKLALTLTCNPDVLPMTLETDGCSGPLQNAPRGVWSSTKILKIRCDEPLAAGAALRIKAKDASSKLKWHVEEKNSSLRLVIGAKTLRSLDLSIEPLLR